MPLSDEELRLLEQMERALSEEDPKFASALRGSNLVRSARRRLVLSGVAFILGVTLLMAGAVSGLWPLGVTGFVVMLVAATVALSTKRVATVKETGSFRSTDASSRPRGKQRRSGTFMQRLEMRWERRRNGGYYGW